MGGYRKSQHAHSQWAVPAHGGSILLPRELQLQGPRARPWCPVPMGGPPRLADEAGGEGVRLGCTFWAAAEVSGSVCSPERLMDALEASLWDKALTSG